MGCFSCFRSHRKRAVHPEHQMLLHLTSFNSSSSSSSAAASKSKKKPNSGGKSKSEPMKVNVNNEARSFTFLELAAATRNFKESNLIGEGGFGRVYKGRIETGQEIAAKRLNSDGQQGNQEFIVEVLMLNLFHHPNLVNLIGYCAEGNHRILVYQYMPMGSLEDHLFGSSSFRTLGWDTRMKIALGAAKGLEYLHCVANPPVIYRDLKSANILLDDDFNPKLSDFGLAKLGPIGDKTHVSTRVMGTYGYCAPDYAMSGKITVKSDIFSFGVVLLELITGRRAYDVNREEGQQSLVAWTRPYLRDRRRLMEIVDPNLEGRFPVRTARHLIALTSMLLKEDPGMRPPISEIVTGLDYLVKEGQINRNWARDDDF